MSITESVAVLEARRVMAVCNACRYCSGFCAVFPAMEIRRSFSAGDLEYMANLCHNCTSCFHACQYAPPHEFHLNVSTALADLRAETYQKYTWPGFMGKLFRRNGAVVSLVTGVSVVLVVLLTFLLQSREVLFAAHRGPGSFYQVIPMSLMVIPPSAMLIFAGLAMAIGVLRYARGTGWSLAELARPLQVLQATIDVFKLRYLGGSGEGCNVHDERFSNLRRWLHQLVFFGFLLCFFSTVVAAIYEHLLHRSAPYDLLSIPVISGTLGGIGLVVGTSGLLWLKMVRDPRAFLHALLGMDLAFLMQLLLTAASGLILLALRDTPGMGVLLAVHLGLVAGLFLALPYSKFVHAIYRFLALVRFAKENPGPPEAP